jgi:hypothetical protein
MFDFEEQLVHEAKTGGSAFPMTFNVDGAVVVQEGLTIRDYFAAKAMEPFVLWALDQKTFTDYDTAAKASAEYAKSAYMIADAMLAARQDKS